AILERLRSEGKTAGNLQLALLYERNGQPIEAERTYRLLLAKPLAAHVMPAASFLFTPGRMDEAQAVLGQLDNVPTNEADRQLIRGGFYAKHGMADQARTHYHQAISAAPTRAALLLTLITHEVRQGNGDRAAAALSQALAV